MSFRGLVLGERGSTHGGGFCGGGWKDLRGDIFVEGVRDGVGLEGLLDIVPIYTNPHIFTLITALACETSGLSLIKMSLEDLEDTGGQRSFFLHIILYGNSTRKSIF